MKNFDVTLHDAKSTRKVTNKILKPNSRSKSEFNTDKEGIAITNDTEIANAFNDYFSSVNQSYARRITDSAIDPLLYLTPNLNNYK